MKQKFLGLVCMVYTTIIYYAYFSKKLGNFLAPSMQKGLLISGIVLLIIGLLFLETTEKEKMKIGDWFLLFPLLFLILANDGKLTTSFANNRGNTFQKTVEQTKNSNISKEETSSIETSEKEEKIEIEEENKNSEINTQEEEKYENIDLKKVDYEVNDRTYSGLSNYLTYSLHPEKYVGRTIRVRGFILKNSPFIPKGYFGIGKYLISCCAADAEFTGFLAKYKNMEEIKEDGWYEIEGILELGEDAYKTEILAIHVINFKKISEKKETLYVYPCYSYGDGSCKEMMEYDFD